MQETSYEVVSARNPKWANPEKNMIDLEVNFGDIAEYEPKKLWTPYWEDKTEASCEALVQILLEKGVLTDEEVDTILLEVTEFKGFSREATDTGSHNGGVHWGTT